MSDLAKYSIRELQTELARRLRERNERIWQNHIGGEPNKDIAASVGLSPSGVRQIIARRESAIEFAKLKRKREKRTREIKAENDRRLSGAIHAAMAKHGMPTPE